MSDIYSNLESLSYTVVEQAVAIGIRNDIIGMMLAIGIAGVCAVLFLLEKTGKIDTDDIATVICPIVVAFCVIIFIGFFVEYISWTNEPIAMTLHYIGGN